MPRQARLDSPGLLHHVMARGLNRQKIFLVPADYLDFIKRIEAALERSPCEILAWALMPNHFHLLVRSGAQGLAPFMRRLSTGYALSFNQRHRRSGYLFQGRYKSLVCEEEEYLLALVRYIHSNPVVGEVVRSLRALERYPYTGHSALMGKCPRPWQAIDEVLGRFGSKEKIARRHYERFLEESMTQTKQYATDLLGGGLLETLRIAGARVRRESDRALYDDRILGDSAFINQVWKDADAREKRQKAFKRTSMDIREVAQWIAKEYAVDERALFGRGRTASVSKAKAVLISIGVEGLGKTLAEMARWTNMTPAAASKAKARGAAMWDDLKSNKLISILRP